MENSFASLVVSSSSVLVLLPVRPYFDQVAAGLALYLAIRDQKETSISCATPMTVEFNRLVGVNKVSGELGSKNLIIKFSDYSARNIERISSEVENDELYLVVVPNPGVKAPARENINMSFSGISADLVILVGGINESHYPQLASKDLMGTKIVHVGTRSMVAPPEKNVLSFARPASSVSEVVLGLIEEMGTKMDADIATNLLAGIEIGSKEFRGPDVTAETFEAAAKLLKVGGQRLPQRSDNQRSASLPSLQESPQDLQTPEEETPKEAPKDWLEPKIYKGTSIS